MNDVRSVERGAAAGQAWVWLNAAALALVMAHVLIDQHIGLFGPSSTHMSGLQALNVFLAALMAGWWAAALALGSSGSRAGLLSALVMALLVSFLGNGLVAVGACPPPCEGAFPYQDITHAANIIVGGAATLTAWRVLRTRTGRGAWWALVVPIALQGASWAATTVLVFGS